MTNIFAKVAHLNHMQAQDAEKNLDRHIDDQRDKVFEKKEIRRVQEYIDRRGANGKHGEGERDTIQSMLSAIGVDMDVESLLNAGQNGGRFEGDSEARRMNRTNRETILRTIDNKMEGAEDSEGLLNFKIQLGMSDMTTAEQGRAQAIKREEDHRKAMQRMWDK